MRTLDQVMNTGLVTVSPATTVAEAATVMSTRHVGSALVMDGDLLIGILTERDIVRSLGSDFDAAAGLVKDWMTPDPTTLLPTSTATEALDLMLEAGFRHLPVVEGGRVLGMVSIRDLTPRA